MEIILKKDKTAAYLNYRNCEDSEQLRIIQEGSIQLCKAMYYQMMLSVLR